MMKQPKVDIIILNWNGLDDTIECLGSLQKLTYPNYRVIIVDNGSKNNELEAIKAAYPNDKKFVFIQNTTNLGFAGGCNVAIDRSLQDGTPFVLLLNNDTLTDPKLLDELVGAAGQDKQAGVVGAKIYLHSEPKEIWTAATYFNFYFPPLSKMKYPDSTVEVNSVIGCCMLIRSSVFEAIGKLDEEYFAYGEEDDFNMRARKAGYKLIYCPSAELWHKVSSSTGGGFNPTVAYLKMRNKIKFAKKNYGFKYWPSYAVFLVAYFLKSQVKAIARRDYKVATALLRGVRDGV